MVERNLATCSLALPFLECHFEQICHPVSKNSRYERIHNKLCIRTMTISNLNAGHTMLVVQNTAHTDKERKCLLIKNVCTTTSFKMHTQ